MDKDRKLIEKIIDSVMTANTGATICAENCRKIQDEIATALKVCLTDPYVVRVTATHTLTDQNKIEVTVTPLPAIDRLAEVGATYRAEAALERGKRDGLRLLNGEVSVDDLNQEVADDPP